MKGMCKGCLKQKECGEYYLKTGKMLCEIAELYANQDYVKLHEKLAQKHLDLISEEDYQDAWEIVQSTFKPDWGKIRTLEVINKRWGKQQRLLTRLEFKCLFYRYARKMSLKEIQEKINTTIDTIDHATKSAIKKLGKKYRHYFPKNHKKYV